VAGAPTGGILERLGDQEVGGGLHANRVAPLRRVADLDRQGGRVGQGRQRRPKAGLGQDGREIPWASSRSSSRAACA
jgi:hypothetical protein